MRGITFIGGQVESKDDAIKEHHTLRKIHEEYSQDSSGMYDWGENFAYQGYTNNSITVGTGKAVVYGRHFEINVAETVNILDGTSTTQFGYIIAKIDMSQPQGSQVVLTHKSQTGSYPTLTKQDVTGNTGIYEFAVVKFTYNSTGILTIENVTRTPFSIDGVLAGKAADSEKLDGFDSSYFARASDVDVLNELTTATALYTGTATMTGNIILSESIYNFARADIVYAGKGTYCGVSSGTNIVDGTYNVPWGGNGIFIIAGASLISSDGLTLSKYGDNHSRSTVIRGGAVSDVDTEGNIGSVYGLLRKHPLGTMWSVIEDEGIFYRVGELDGEIRDKVEISQEQYSEVLSLDAQLIKSSASSDK